MKKLRTAAVAILAIGLWLMPVTAAAQGRAVGRPDGAPGGVGSHAPLGSPGADVQHGNGHGSAQDATGSHDTTPSGPKAPATLLGQNTQLASKLEGLLGISGNLTALKDDASGFKNLGQFVAAVHVSYNLKISFTELKCTELGTTKATSLNMSCPRSVTNASGMSLGKAIQTIQPHADSQEAVQTANQETKKDLANTRS